MVHPAFCDPGGRAVPTRLTFLLCGVLALSTGVACSLARPTSRWHAHSLGLAVVHLVLFTTRWGLRTRAVGEHPQAADTLGVSVVAIRYGNVIAGGMIAGLGSAWFSLETVGSFADLMTGGKGFIALAAMIFGNWNPLGVLAGALLFGFTDTLQIKLQIAGVEVPYQFLGMLPYLATMIILTGVVGRAWPPAASGKPYRRQTAAL